MTIEFCTKKLPTTYIPTVACELQAQQCMNTISRTRRGYHCQPLARRPTASKNVYFNS